MASSIRWPSRSRLTVAAPDQAIDHLDQGIHVIGHLVYLANQPVEHDISLFGSLLKTIYPSHDEARELLEVLALGRKFYGKLVLLGREVNGELRLLGNDELDRFLYIHNGILAYQPKTAPTAILRPGGLGYNLPMATATFDSSYVAERESAIPWYLWAGLIATTSAVVGGQWDISWHRSIGRDTFWTPAHMAIYLCGLIAVFGKVFRR